MKNFFKIFIVGVMAMAANVSFAQNTFYSFNTTEQFKKNVNTTGSTVTVADTLLVANNDAGIIKIRVMGYYADSVDVFNAVKTFRYTKKNGTISVSVAAIDSSQTVTTNLSGASTYVTPTASNNIQITVTGKASKTVNWTVIKTLYYYRKNS